MPLLFRHRNFLSLHFLFCQFRKISRQCSSLPPVGAHHHICGRLVEGRFSISSAIYASFICPLRMGRSSLSFTRLKISAGLAVSSTV